MPSDTEPVPDTNCDSGKQLESSNEDVPLSELREKLQGDSTPMPKKKCMFVT